MKKMLNVLALFLSISLAQAEIRETQSMVSALQDARPGDLVVLDIDNTILRPMQSLGSDQWFGLMVKQNEARGLTHFEAINQAIMTWNQVAKVTRVTPVEEDTPKTIRELQAKGINVIALTARSLEIQEASLRQLQSIGVSLKPNFYPRLPDQSVDFKQGVIFVGPHNNKGKVLGHVLNYMETKPSRIIFVDDKLHHVQSMEEVFGQLNIANINYRYGAADAIVKSLDEKVVNTQLGHFLTKNQAILSDKDAQ